MSQQRLPDLPGWLGGGQHSSHGLHQVVSLLGWVDWPDPVDRATNQSAMVAQQRAALHQHTLTSAWRLPPPSCSAKGFFKTVAGTNDTCTACPVSSNMHVYSASAQCSAAAGLPGLALIAPRVGATNPFRVLTPCATPLTCS